MQHNYLFHPTQTVARKDAMSLVPGFATARDLLEKLRREAALLDEEITSDRFFNFAVTGYSLIDWIKNNPSIPTTTKTAVVALYRDRWIQVCGDIATAGKHFTLTSRVPITAATSSERGFGLGGFGKGGWGVGEGYIEIRLNDGTVLLGPNLVSGVIQTWQQFFLQHGL